MKSLDIDLNIKRVDSLIERKKEEKRKRLIDAAYECFTVNTVSGTSIAEICKTANIAKGTFYLYFKDKEDIVRTLNKELSYQALKTAYHAVTPNTGTFVDNAVLMAETLISYFEEDHEVVRLMKKDFVWPISETEFLTSQDPIMSIIRSDIAHFSETSGISSHEILVRLYALISMIASICYSCIIDQFPADINAVKPQIYEMIRASFQPIKKA